MKSSLYKQNIIDHYKNPRNFGVIDNADKSEKIENISCGDELTLYIKTDGKVITDVKFQGSGCAISIASASMLYDKLKGMDLEQVRRIGPDEIFDMIGMSNDTPRVKCVLLSWEALKKIIR